MGLREDALKSILSLDAGRSAQLSLQLAQDKVRASSGAVLAIEGDRYLLFATTQVDQRDLGRIAEAWDASRPSLLAGEPTLRESWSVLPVGRPVTGLVYFGGSTLSLVDAERLSAELDQIFGLALAVREEEPEARRLFQMMLQKTPLRNIAKEQLRLVLRAHGGNKSAAARALGVTRVTLYKRIAKHGLEDPT